MSGFGERLRRQREMRGVSLEEISQSTKIGTRSLKAIEDEDFEKLPGGIFNKGFVRAYARFLGLDEDQIVGDFDEAWNAYEASRTPQVLATPEEEKEKSSSGATWIAVFFLMVIVGAAAGWYRYEQTRNQAAAPPSSPTDSSVAAPQNTASPENVTPSAPPTSAAPSASVQSGNRSPGPDAEKPRQEPKTTEPSTEPSTLSEVAPIAPAPTSTAPKTASSAPIRLRVFAREDSWLSVSADGKDLGQGILIAQKTRAIQAQKEVRLKIGNLAGVEISFNGRPVDVDGQPKQVKELIFTAEGLQQ